MNLPEHRKKMLKEVAVVSAIAIPVLVELVYQIYFYIKKRKDEDG